MKLIIAEKPSLGRTVASAISNSVQKKDGYMIAGDYCVTFAFGHLFGLYDLDEYNKETWKDGKPPAWSMDVLPFFPEQFRFALKKDSKTRQIDKGIKKQFEIIKELMNREENTEIVHCGDSDREGELIVRIIIAFGLKDKSKPINRLWLPEQTPEGIRSQLGKMKPDNEYDNLFEEGKARTYIDWLYGINLSRYATLKSGSRQNVGRVVTPIIRAIYERDKAIKEFVPVKFWKVESKANFKGTELTLTAKKKYDYDAKNSAGEYAKILNDAGAYVESVEKKEKVKQPPKLFSLSKLQGSLGKKYKLSMKECLDLVQSLYEKGYVSYPRTNTEYLAENEVGRIEQIIGRLAEKGHELTVSGKDRNFDNSKVESHSALTPTTRLPGESELKGNEQLVYSEIVNRFLAVFCAEKCKYEETVATIACATERFSIKGNTITSPGYLKYENNMNEKALPLFVPKERLNVDFKPTEGETKPPKAYTVEALNNYLKNPFKADKEASEDELYKDLLSGLEIGTEATRADIIEGAIKNGYISLKNNVYSIEDKGKYIVELLESLEIDLSAETTARLGKILKDVYKGVKSTDEALGMVENHIKACFKQRDKPVIRNETVAEIVGYCVSCGSGVEKKSAGYFCSNKECDFKLFKKMRYFSNELSITDSRAKALLGKKGVAEFTLKSKNGDSYKGKLRIVINGKYVNFERA
ncbi:DNA topoisomerase-3 [Lachnospiraceae bacterium PM6-15]|uniref:DNA topoisomerase n=1 Tax=Ohessyouella blattaphilus TaxID=2949333 RepID=UPI003E2CAFC1